MTDTTQAEAPETPIVAFEKPAGTPDAMGAREAGRLLSSLRKPKAAVTTVTTTETREPAAPVQESTTPVDDAAPAEQATGETQEADPAEVPPIERPRSWAKEHDEHWKALPRATQEYLIEQASQASAEVRRSQNEAAEKLKGLTAKEQAVDTARQQYESALPILLQNLQANLSGEFADITTMADVGKMANEDFPRYIRWDAQQKQVAAVTQEIGAAQQRESQEKQTKLMEFIRHETELLHDKIPELKDEKHRIELTSSVISMLKSEGFSDQELGDFTEGRKDLSVYDHRFRSLMIDAYRYREGQQKLAAIKSSAKPVPQVQRPGVAQSKGAQAQAQVQTLARKLENAKGVDAIRIATDLMKLRRKAAS